MFLARQHPSTRQLLRHQQSAKLAQTVRGFRSPRRIVLSIIAAVLAIVWIGQAIAGIFFREAADPNRLFNWLTFGLGLYAVWNFLKVVFRKPVEPFEWTEAEKEWLAGAPLSRAHLVRYRLGSISSAALVKASIFTLVMIPDLKLLPLGFLGAYIGLMLIELIRTGLEVVAFGLTDQERLVVRTVVGFFAAAAALVLGSWFYNQWQAGQFQHLFTVEFIHCCLEGIQSIPGSTIGSIALAPFAVLVDLMLADSLSLPEILRIIVCMTALFVAARLLEALDTIFFNRSNQAARDHWSTAVRSGDKGITQCFNRDSRRRFSIPSWKGIGCLCWRQAMGVNHYRGTVLVALVVPMILAIAPAFGDVSGWQMVEQMIVLLACYSFLLLPTALKFDFRRDLDRINILKTLPTTSFAITLGQLSVPVVATSFFQILTLLVAMIINPFHPGLLVVAIVILVPINLFIFGLENLMFLLYPYRINGEGIQIFLRTILAFTAKGLLMLVGLAVGFGCMLVSILIGKNFASPETASMMIFAALGGLLVSIVAASVVMLLARTFDKLDPSQDLSAEQH